MSQDNWRVVRLGELGSTYGGLSGKSARDFRSGSARYVTFLNVVNNVVLDPSGTSHVTIDPDERQSLVQAGDILFNGSSETPEEAGLAAAVPDEVGGLYLNSFCFGFRPHPGAQLDPTFFAFLSRSQDGRAAVRSLVQGSTRFNVSSRRMLNAHFLLPSLLEQVAIAEALTDASSLVESLNALIAKKRGLRQAAILELLKGGIRLPGSSEPWERARIGDFAEILKGKGLSRTSMNRAGKNRCMLYGELFTTYGQVVREAVGRTNEDAGTPSRSGDVVMPGSTTTSGEDLATATALLQDDVKLGGDINIIRPDRRSIDSRWLAYTITHCLKHDVARATQGITIHHLYGRNIADISVLLPSRDEQERIADVIEDFDSEIVALTAQRDKAELVKQGMMQGLLSGRVRLT